MATLTTATYDFWDQGAAGALKTMIGMICDMCSDIEIIEVVSDTSTLYDVYVKILDYDEYIIHLYNSSASTSCVYQNKYIKSDAGTVTVGGQRYRQVLTGFTDNGFLVNANSQRTYKISCIHELGVYVSIRIEVAVSTSTTYYFCLGGFKSQDSCSGDIRTSISAWSTSGAPVSCHSTQGDSYQIFNISSIIPTKNNNGYTRMHPTYVYSDEFVGTLTDPSLVYCGYSGGSTINIAAYTPFSVGGVNFISLGGGYAIKAD